MRLKFCRSTAGVCWNFFNRTVEFNRFNRTSNLGTQEIRIALWGLLSRVTKRKEGFSKWASEASLQTTMSHFMLYSVKLPGVMEWQGHLLDYYGQLFLHYWRTQFDNLTCWWVLLGACLLGWSNYDCIWLAKFPPLMCIEIGR
jgi:hypothetical protein